MSLKQIVLLLIIFSASSTACAQLDSKAIKYANEINEKDARKHLTILASDEFEGRDTGKPGGKKAADYIANEFKKLNLTAPVDNSYLQPVHLIQSKFEVKSFKLDDRNFKLGDGFYMTGAGEEKTISANEIVFIGYGISDAKYDDLKDIDIAGKVVLIINQDEPRNKDHISYITGTSQGSSWSVQRNKRLHTILAKNPLLILAASKEVQQQLNSMGDSFNKGRMMLKDDFTMPATIPAIAHITFDFADQFLKKNCTSLSDLKATIDKNGKPINKVFNTKITTTFGTIAVPVESNNVLGYLEGGDLKDELVVISAHYDHVGVEDGEIFNGADDDGSGTTGVIEMAKAFAKSKEQGDGPRRSILFLAVTGEEKGLLGSDFYTRYPVFPLKNTVSNLNIDMIGRVDPIHESNPDYIYLIGSDKLSSDLHRISESVNSKYTKLTLDYTFNDPNDPERIYYRSDHYNFAKNGIPVIFYFNGVHEDYHKPTDTVDKINFELLVKRTKLVFHTAWEIANRDQRLVVDSNKK